MERNLNKVSKSGTRLGWPFSPYLLNIVFIVLATAIRRLKEFRGLQIGKIEVNVSLLADDMTVYISDSKILPENSHTS